jgi:hypothetical protein
MSLIIEDGTGVAGADSFVTVAEGEAFEVAYFGQSLAGSPQAKEAAWRRAFVVMSGLPWKNGLFPTFCGTIPDAVKNAQHVIARVEFQSPGSLSPVFDKSKAKTLIKVGEIAWQAKAGPNTVEAARPLVTMAQDFLNAARGECWEGGLLETSKGVTSWLLRA